MAKFFLTILLIPLILLNTTHLFGLALQSTFQTPQTLQSDNNEEGLGTLETFSKDALTHALLYTNGKDISSLLHTSKGMNNMIMEMPTRFWKRLFIEKIEGKTFDPKTFKSIEKKYPSNVDYKKSVYYFG